MDHVYVPCKGDGSLCACAECEAQRKPAATGACPLGGVCYAASGPCSEEYLYEWNVVQGNCCYWNDVERG